MDRIYRMNGIGGLSGYGRKGGRFEHSRFGGSA